MNLAADFRTDGAFVLEEFQEQRYRLRPEGEVDAKSDKLFPYLYIINDGKTVRVSGVDLEEEVVVTQSGRQSKKDIVFCGSVISIIGNSNAFVTLNEAFGQKGETVKSGS